MAFQRKDMKPLFFSNEHACTSLTALPCFRSAFHPYDRMRTKWEDVASVQYATRHGSLPALDILSASPQQVKSTSPFNQSEPSVPADISNGLTPSEHTTNQQAMLILD